MSIKMTVISRTPSGKNLVRTDGEGWLWCILCGANWCDHIRDAVKENLDGPALWRELAVEDHRAIVTLVPHYAAPSGRVPVRMSLYSNDTASHAIVSFHETPQGRHIQTPTMGITSFPEGRVVISRMVDAWLEAEYAYFNEIAGGRTPRCDSRTHTAERRAALNAALRSEPKAQHKNFFTCTFYELCILCYKESGGAARRGFDPDLIPTT